LELTGFNEGEIAALSLDDAKPPTKEQESSTKEIDPDDFTLGHRCPRCGFEFDDDK